MLFAERPWVGLVIEVKLSQCYVSVSCVVFVVVGFCSGCGWYWLVVCDPQIVGENRESGLATIMLSLNGFLLKRKKRSQTELVNLH